MIPLSSSMSKTSTTRSHRGDTTTLSADKSKRNCQVEMPVSNARSTSLVLAILNLKSRPKFASTQPSVDRYRLELSCRCGSESSMVFGCFGGGDALAATSSRTIIWTVIGMIARICASCITAPTLRLSSWFRGSPSPSSRSSSPSGISTTVPPVVLLLLSPRALVPTTYATTRTTLSPLHPVSAAPLGRLAA